MSRDKTPWEQAMLAIAAGAFTPAGNCLVRGKLFATYKSETIPLHFCLIPGYGCVAGDSAADLQWKAKNAGAWLKAQRKQEKQDA